MSNDSPRTSSRLTATPPRIFRMLDFSLSFQPNRGGRWPLSTVHVCVRSPHRGACVRPWSGCIGRLKTHTKSREAELIQDPPKYNLTEKAGWLIYFFFLHRNWCCCCAVKCTPFWPLLGKRRVYETGSGNTLVPSWYPRSIWCWNRQERNAGGAFYGKENICLAMKRAYPVVCFSWSRHQTIFTVWRRDQCFMHITATLEDDLYHSLLDHIWWQPNLNCVKGQNG